ncbi:peptide/nickel transport system permease protein [[Clostridium] aminophilum]|uniref:Peptide/nickel transport system permease protein n=1 Tax=[Clostridium] aminophilum TaxID=1526 RepID=A0A1I0BW15_9FIRM|nr:ABC transporter permease [[Clostridium] aminophilum]SET10847.1 peptide/nickel transport system permease protein [[Clostridium] aminophilum]
MKRNYNLIIGLAITALFLVMAVVGQFWTPYNVTSMNSAAAKLAPSAAHLMGTDKFGRDVFSRIMNGSGTTFFVAVCVVMIGVFFGTVIGALTGYFGGLFDNIVMRINDILLSFPSILLALIFISLFGSGRYRVILALGVLFVPSFARIVRSEVIRAKELDYVKSAKIIGVSTPRIIFAHILPNGWVSMLTTSAIGFNNAVLAEASMSYLGLGVQPPEPSLGLMLSESQASLFNMPWCAVFPGLTIIMIILGFSLIAEGLRKMQE